MSQKMQMPEAELAQRELIDRLHKHVKRNDDTWVPEGITGTVIVNGRAYRIEGGERMWLQPRQRSKKIFYVTLENQRVQLNIEITSDGAIISKTVLGAGGVLGARPRVAVSHSS